MDRLKELCNQFKDAIKYIPMYCSEQYEELQKYSELCRLINAIADLSSGKIARALDYTIKEIAYASAEPNFEVRKKYLSEAIKDLLSGMDEVDVVLKYDKILYDLRNPKPEHRGYRAKILIVDDLCDIDKEELKEVLKERPMIKFWLDDFDYTKRFGCVEPFGYLFNVRGESANYLINKYQLGYPKIFVNCYMDKTIYIGSKQYDGKKSDCCDCDEDDVEELYSLLKPIMDIDLRNYEDYMCDDWYKKDSRWE